MDPPEGQDECSKKCREEFRCSRFALGYKFPRHFVTAQCGGSLVYPIWTIILLLYHLAWVIVMVVLDHQNDNLPDPKWFIFLTNWSYFLLNLAFFWDFCCTQYLHITKSQYLKEKEGTMPWYLMVDWVLFNVKNSFGLLVTFGYYGLLTVHFTAPSIEKHALNSVAILLDFFLSSKPVRLLHVYQPMCSILVYGIFSFIYQKSGNDAIYPILDWNNSFTVVYVIGLGIIGIPVFHCVLFGLYHLRMLISRVICGVKKDEYEDIEMGK